MTPASAKAKGRGLQQKVVAAILARFPDLTADDVRSTSMGAGGEDVQLSTAARMRLPFNIECKKRKAHAVYAFIDQAGKHGGCTPLAVIEADRRKPLAVVDLDFFLDMMVRVNTIVSKKNA